MAESTLHRSRALGLSKFSTFHQEDVDLEFVEDLVDSKRWEIYSVSHLFNFNPSEKNLRFYNKKIRELVASYQKHDTAAEVTAELKVDRGFGTTVYDSEAIIIEVTIEELKTNEKENPKIYTFHGIMLSRGQLSSEGWEPQLPLLLTRCKSATLLDGVINCLAAIFDCHVIKVPLRQVDLHWLLAIVLELDDDSDSTQQIDLTLTYQPHQHSNNVIDIGMNTLTLQKIWNKIRGGNQGVVDTDEAEVDLLMETVSQHLLNTMNISMQNMTLVGVNTLYGSFFFNGKVIFKSREVTEVILRFLTKQLLLEERFDTQQYMHQQNGDSGATEKY